jgi:hypothetical protein
MGTEKEIETYLRCRTQYQRIQTQMVQKPVLQVNGRASELSQGQVCGDGVGKRVRKGRFGVGAF